MPLSDALNRIVPAFSKQNLHWGVWAGSAALFYGSERRQDDIDVFFLRNDTDAMNSALKQLDVPLLRWNNDNPMFNSLRSTFYLKGTEVDVCSDIEVMTGGKAYTFRSDAEMFEKVRQGKLDSVTVPVLSPEDVIVFKAICQRTEKEGKFDDFDVRNILKNQEIDFAYLEKRAVLCNAKERVARFVKALK